MIRILVVDDHPAIRAGLVTVLRTEPGLTPVAVGESVASALAEARRSPPDVAIVDYHLPDGDGLDLTARLKELSEPPAVVLYTAFAADGLHAAAGAAGANALVDKTEPFDRLLDVVRQVAAGATLVSAMNGSAPA